MYITEVAHYSRGVYNEGIGISLTGAERTRTALQYWQSHRSGNNSISTFHFMLTARLTDSRKGILPQRNVYAPLLLRLMKR